jgi:hypothetical protein
MAEQQNAESIFQPPTYSQKIFAALNGSYKLSLQVHNFNGYVRVGISKQIWCKDANDYVHAKKGHCYFPLEVCDTLEKYLPTAKIEADRLDKQVNGHAKPQAVAGNGPVAFFGASELHQRGGNAYPRVAVASETVGQHQAFSKRRADDYKTDDGCSNRTPVGGKHIPRVIAQHFIDVSYSATSKRWKAKCYWCSIAKGVERFVENSSPSVFERHINRIHKARCGSNLSTSDAQPPAQRPPSNG